MARCCKKASVHGVSQARIWRGLPFPSPGDLPDPESKPGSPGLQADSFIIEQPGKPAKGQWSIKKKVCESNSTLKQSEDRAYLVAQC